MIIAGQLLLPDQAGGVRIALGHLRLQGEIIAEVIEGEIPDSPDFGSPESLITPGFIDAHVHLPQFNMIGAHGLPLLEWLNQVTFLAEQKWKDTAYAESMTARVVDQLFSHGTTAACAYATVHYDAAAAALGIAQSRGLRGLIGQTLTDRQVPEFLCRPTAQLVDETARLLRQFPAKGRMAAAVTPRFAISCTPELLTAAGQLAKEHAAFVQSHLAETAPECKLVAELFEGSLYVDVYGCAGLLGPKSIYGHGIHLDENDRQTLHQSGAIIAHCPTANSFLRSGAMNRKAVLASDVRLALGSDIGAGYERSMVRVARAMLETASALGEDYPAAVEAWWQITAGNAEVLGWKDAGTLRAGDPADLVWIQPDIPWLASPAEPLAMLLFAWDDRWIKRTWARGEVVYGVD